MRIMSFINLTIHYTDLTIEELTTDVVDIDVTEGVEDTTQQLPINITGPGNDDFQDCNGNDNLQDCTGNDNLQDGNDDLQHSESADLMEIDHGNKHKSTNIENDILVA